MGDQPSAAIRTPVAQEGVTIHLYTYFYKLSCHNDSPDVHCKAYNMFLKPCNKNLFLVMQNAESPMTNLPLELAP